MIKEEIVVRREAGEHTEMIQDWVRRTEIEDETRSGRLTSPGGK